MKPCKIGTLFMLIAGVVFTIPSRAQTNHAAGVMRTITTRLMAPMPIAVRTVTNAIGNLATVRFTLPQTLDTYNVLEEGTHVTRAATNFAALSHNEVQALLAAGNTLMFVNKTPRLTVPLTSSADSKQSSYAASKQLFSTFFVKAIAPARPGGQLRTASGSLTMFADDPVLWDAASNAYVAYLTLIFSTEDSSPNNPLLPMSVTLSGHHVKDIAPRSVELEKADASKEVVVTCGQYQTNVQITAHYLTATTTIPLQLQKLTLWGMIQMIISAPMLFAALTGGLIGGLLRLFRGRKWGMKHILHYLAEGATVGLVTVSMFLSGLLHSQISGLPSQPQLVLAFALAAAAGSVGAHFLDKAINRLRGKWPPPQTEEKKP